MTATLSQAAHSACSGESGAAIGASRWTAIGDAVDHGARLVSYLAVAPAIGPHDFGLFVIAAGGVTTIEAALSHIAHHAMAALREVSPGQISTAFLLAAGAAATVSLMLSGVASAVTLLCDDPAVGDIMGSLAVLPLLAALAFPPAALLRRQSSFVPLSLSRVAGAASGGVVCGTLAWAGTGPWSLVAQLVVQQAVEATLLWAIAGHQIGLAWSQRDAATICRGLSGAVLTKAMNDAGRHLVPPLIGLVLGPVAAGLYFIAAQLANAVSAAVRLPWRGAERRGAGVSRQAGFRVLVVLATIAAMPIVLPALLDPCWYGAVRPAQILSAGAIAFTLMAACENWLAPRLSASHGLVWVWPAWLTVPASVGLAAQWGLAPAAAAAAAPAMIGALFQLYAVRRRGIGTIAPLFKELGQDLGAAAVAGAAVSVLAQLIGPALQPVSAVLVIGTATLGSVPVFALAAYTRGPGAASNCAAAANKT